MSTKKTTGIILGIAILIMILMLATVAGSAASAGIAYTNSTYNFSLTLPASWAGLYRMEESASGVYFYNIRNEMAGYGGFLFSVFVSDKTEPVDWGYKELIRSGGLYYYSATPTDVQFAYDNDSLTKEYQNMEKDIDSILRTFRLGSTSSPGSQTTGLVAKPTASTVYINGKIVVFDAYNINDSNYFKLRDIAFSLNGTPKQFEVGWSNANDAISLTSGWPYTVVGGEMAGKGSSSKSAAPTSSKVYVNGKETQFTAYNIDGYNYFKLRDVGQAIDFGVDYDESRDAIMVDTGKSYDAAPGNNSGSTNDDRSSIVRDYRSELVGSVWHRSDVLGSGWAERFLLMQDNSFIYAASEMDGETRTRFIRGTWSISDGYLVFNFQKARVLEGGQTIPATGSIGTVLEIINAKLVDKTYAPAEQHRILIGNYIYSADMPHPWSINFETSDPLFDGWWYKYEGQYDYDQLVEDADA